MKIRTPVLGAAALIWSGLALAQATPRGVAAENIDKNASPCSDFDAYANGQWRATHTMPADQTAWAVRTVTQDETRARLRSIAEEDAAKASKETKGSPAQLTGDFYAACMDQAKVDAAGLKPLDGELKRIAAVHDAASLNAEIVALEGIEVTAPVALSAEQDVHATTHMIADVYISGLSLPDRDYYLRDEPRFKDAREAYLKHVRAMSGLGGASADDASAVVSAVMKIETALAQAALTRVELRDPKLTDNPMTLAKLKAMAPHFD